MERETQAQRIAQLKRTELLDAAVAEMVQAGWRGLQMQGVAKRVGVSRQTVYNTFGAREELAAAVVGHLTDGFLTGFERCFESETEPFDQWAAAIQYMLRRGVEDPAVRAMLRADSSDRFLELLTSASQPLITSARARITVVAMRCQPDLDPGQVSEAAEIIARLTLSYIVQPMHSLEHATTNVGSMVTAFLASPLRCRTLGTIHSGKDDRIDTLGGLPDQRRQSVTVSGRAAS